MSITPEVNADDLRLLLAVARTGRMISAGLSVGLDHTTVSRRIRRLEQALGATLLTRTAEGWQLTPIGAAVVEQSSPLEGIIHRVRAIATAEGPGLHGTVRIAAPDGFGSAFVAPAVTAVLAQNPGLAVELVTSTRPLQARGAGFDLSITIGDPQGRGVFAELLTEYSLALYASRTYLERHEPIRAEEDLRDHVLVFYVDSLLTVEELDLKSRFSGLRPGFSSTNVFGQLEATKSGAGLGLLPAFMASREPDLVRVLPSDIHFSLRFVMSARQASIELEAVRAIRSALQREVARRADELVLTGG